MVKYNNNNVMGISSRTRKDSKWGKEDVLGPEEYARQLAGGGRRGLGDRGEWGGEWGE